MKFNIDQQMLTLSYISYTGYCLTGSDKHNARKIAPKIVEDLALELPTADKWRLVWGPAVSELFLSIFDDNMAYVVQHMDKPNCFAVVFRGTNPVSLSNWIDEDFFVFRKDPWMLGNKKIPGAKISRGTHLAMKKVKNLEAPSGCPGAGTTMLQFLRIQSETQTKPLEVYVTGHSLGGTLSATYGLFLKQSSGNKDIPVKEQWDPTGKAKIIVKAFAGATAGNKGFAEYSDSLLDKKAMNRIGNSLDLVPNAWNRDTVKKWPDIFKPVAKPNWFFDIFIFQAKIAAALTDYTQPQADTPLLQGSLSDPCNTYFQQTLYQHVVAYPTLLGLEGVLDPVKYFPILKDVLPCYGELKGDEATA